MTELQTTCASKAEKGTLTAFFTELRSLVRYCSFTLEHKIHIFSQPCNILSLYFSFAHIATDPLPLADVTSSTSVNAQWLTASRKSSSQYAFNCAFKWPSVKNVAVNMTVKITSYSIQGLSHLQHSGRKSYWSV